MLARRRASARQIAGRTGHSRGLSASAWALGFDRLLQANSCLSPYRPNPPRRTQPAGTRRGNRLACIGNTRGDRTDARDILGPSGRAAALAAGRHGAESDLRTHRRIVANAVEARRAGQTADTARETISAGLAEAQAGFAPAVQPLVDWVYELPEDDLKKDVAGAWVTQCEAQ